MTIFYAYGVDSRAEKSSQMVDVPSNQRRWLDLDSLMRTSDSRGVIYH